MLSGVTGCPILRYVVLHQTILTIVISGYSLLVASSFANDGNLFVLTIYICIHFAYENK